MDTKNIQSAFDTFLDDKVSSLNKNHKIGICVAAVVIPLALFYFLSFSPKSKNIQQLTASISSLEKELANVKLKAAEIEEQQALMKEMEIKFKEASVLIPDNQEIPSLLKTISSQGTGAGLDILSFVPGAESPKEFYAEIPVSLSVQGTYHNLGYFLDTVSKLPRIVNVSNISMGAPKMEAGEMMLNTKVSLVTYKFLDQPIAQ
nr:type 4a pilus biogenesis protein PilO [Desulfobulbaceae bacterium]